nr:MAG TPA: Transcription initiation factor IIE, alpha FINGER, Transcription [Caudoviricetes sp.]
MNNFLELKNEDNTNIKVFDDVEIIVDPELEDESTIDINNYVNKFILQCRICGNMFPSDEILENETECPVCGEISNDGFIFKGKLKKKQNEENVSDDKEKAIDELLSDESNNINEIPISNENEIVDLSDNE